MSNIILSNSSQPAYIERTAFDRFYAVPVERGLAMAEDVIGELSRHNCPANISLQGRAGPVGKKWDGQLKILEMAAKATQRAYGALEDLSDQTVGLDAGSGEIYLDHLIALASTLPALSDALKSDFKNIQWALDDEGRDLIKAIGPEIKRAKGEYAKALGASNAARESQDPKLILESAMNLEEAVIHLKLIKRMGTQVKKLEYVADQLIGPLADAGTILKSQAKAISQALEALGDISDARNDAAAVAQALEQCDPEAIRAYLNECLKKEDFLAFKRSVRPLFSGGILVPKDIIEALAKGEGLPIEGYDYRAKNILEMRRSYLYGRMTEAERKKFKELTSLESEPKGSKWAWLFLGMQAMVLLRGAGSLLLGHDAATLKTRAEHMHRQVMDAIDPKLRIEIEKDASFMGTLLSDQWDGLKENKLLSRLSPQAQEAVQYLLENFNEAPTSSQIQVARDVVINFRLGEHVPSPYQHMSIGEWFEQFTRLEQEEVAPQAAKVEAIAKPVLGTEVAERSLSDFGNKHRHLVELRELITGIGMKDVEVPPPFGLANQEIQRLLRRELPSVYDRWQQLGQLYASRKGEEGLAFLQREDVSALLKAIRSDIMNTFARTEAPPELSAWLKNMKGYLMVRSSGDEDSSYANAGGNLSVPYVEPKPSLVMAAVGQVVASYFSIPSLANRLNARANPFDNELKLAVTMQELIGEELGGSPDPKLVPVSLVLFTNEPNLGGDDKFRIMRIGATYGHGEAVVGNQGIVTDSFFIMQSRINPNEIYWRSDIKEKPQRLAPVFNRDGNPVLDKIDNFSEMRKKPVLDERMLRRLFQLGKQVEERYGSVAQDMEIVIIGDKIYPVQTRDVNRPQAKPHYVDPEKIPQDAVIQELRGNHQVSGTGEALVIRDPTEMLVAETLGEAESKFQLGKHRIIINRQREPEASHYVVNFSGIGIPALQYDDITPIQEAQRSITGGRSLVIDIQDASIRVWKESAGKPEDALSKGYLNFPGRVSISLNLEDLPPNLQGRELPQTLELKELIRSIKLAKTSELAQGKIKELCEHPVIKSLGTKVDELEQRLNASGSDSLRTRLAVEARKAVDKRIQDVCGQAMHTTQVENRMELRQYTAEFEALLFSNSGAIILAPLTEQAEMILDYVDEVGGTARFEDLLADGENAPLPATRQRWREVLKTLERADDSLLDRIDRFIRMTDLLRMAGAMESWMTLALIGDIPTDPAVLLDKLLQGVDASTLNLLNELISTQSTLRERRRDLPNFADPATFEGAWKRLQGIVGKFRDPDMLASLKSSFSSKSLPLTLIGQSVLIELVDVFDKSIKSMKASTRYEEADKIRLFREMVGSYLELFESWVRDFGILSSPHIDSNYINWLRDQYYNAPNTTNSLRSSAEFAIPPALIFSANRLIIAPPKHLEDIFTLVHQNLLEVVTYQGKEVVCPEVLKTLDVSKVFKRALDEVNSLGDIHLLGLVREGSKLVVKFNLPIRYHSSTFQLIFDAQTEETFFQFQFLGVQINSRWNKLIEKLDLLDIMGKIHLASTPISSSSGLDFCCRLDDESLDQVLRSTRAMIGWSSALWDLSSMDRSGLPIRETLLELIRAQQIDRLVDSPRAADLRYLLILGALGDVNAHGTRALSNWSPKMVKSLEKIADNFETLPAPNKRDFLDLLEKLVILDNQWAKQWTVAIAAEAVKDMDWTVMVAAFRLFLALVDRGQGSSEAIISATSFVNDHNLYIRSAALKFLTGLVKRGQGYQEAIAVAVEAMKDDKKDIKEAALQLFVVLVKKGQAYPEAEAALAAGMKHPDLQWEKLRRALKPTASEWIIDGLGDAIENIWG